MIDLIALVLTFYNDFCFELLTWAWFNQYELNFVIFPFWYVKDLFKLSDLMLLGEMFGTIKSLLCDMTSS